MTNKGGFTLIELLVVVLIIGILAGVALPQYKTAVEKSRASEAFVIGRHLAEAEELFYLANGAYTDDWDSLSADKPSSSNYTFALDKTVYNIKVNQNRIPSLHLRFFMQHVISPFAGKYLCVTKPDEEEGVRICKSLSGSAAPQDYVHMSGYVAYALN